MKRLSALVCLLLLATPPCAHAQNAAEQLDMKAHQAFDDGNFDEAINYWTRELKLDPKNATVYFNRALAYEKNEDTGNALADYAAAISINPADADSCEHRAKIYAGAAMDVFDQGGDPDATDKADWDKAIADYTAALEIRIKDVPDPKAWLEKKSKFGTEEYNYALDVACWSEIIKLDPKNSSAWFHRAQVDPAVGDPGRELADYSEVITLDPKNVKALIARAGIYSEKPEDAAKALADYSEAIRIDPDKGACLARADIYTKFNQDDKAIADCNEAIRLGAGADGYDELLSIHTKERDWDKVIADYAKIVELNPSSETYHERASFYYGRKDWDQVIADMNEAMKMDVKEADDQVENLKENGDDTATRQGDGIGANSLLMRGDAYARKGMYDKALADFRHAASADADDWAAADAEAWLLAACPDDKFRNGPKAVALAMKTCLGTGWLETSPVDTLAAAEAETDDWKQAVDYETQAIKTAKDDEQDARDDDSLDTDDRQDRIDDDERKIGEYTARLALYQKKQPCRDCKQLEWTSR